MLEREAVSSAPTAADLLDPIACDEFVSLGQGMDTIPDPLIGRSDFGGGVKNFLSFDMNRVVVFREGGDDGDEPLNLVAPFFEGVFVGQTT